MADKTQNKTTSNKALEGINEITHTSSSLPTKPRDGNDPALYPKLTATYQLIKARHQKYQTLNAKVAKEESRETENETNHEDWHEVCALKNKLKRKKKLSTSLTSVNDAVNQEKRTRIEGMQLNCRGKLRSNCDKNVFLNMNERILNAKPPVPTKVEKPIIIGGVTTNTGTLPPLRVKRKLQENIQTIQKLSTLTEQLRLEINDLKTNLVSERGAVRALRAQNECESRKWKNDVKKLQLTIDAMKKNNCNATPPKVKPTENGEGVPHAEVNSLVNYEIQRLTNEIAVLKETNRSLEDKKLITGDADRRKAADMRSLRDSYEIRLTHVQKSAKNEITRLLEEIKTKERNIGQLKRDLQILQNSTTKIKKSDNNSNNNNNNNNTNNNNNCKNASTKSNQTTKTTKKPKKSFKNQILKSDASGPAKVEPETSQETRSAQTANEVTKLSGIELMKNTKNMHKSTEALISTQNCILQDDNKQKLFKKMAAAPQEDNLKSTELPANGTKCSCQKAAMHKLFSHGVTNCHHDKTKTISNNNNNDSNNSNNNDNDSERVQREFRVKDNSNSDSDSAVSSAPPSISPQPPATNMDSADIWLTIRTYTQDIEKLQKEIENLVKENERLQAELSLAKDHISEMEKTAIEAKHNSKINELTKRIKCLEAHEHHLQAEASELREQNELLEFRIIELEENNDKWSLQSQNVPSASSISTSKAATTAPTSLISSTQTNASISDENSLISTDNNVWCCDNRMNFDSGITSPQSLRNPEDDLKLRAAHEELCENLKIIMNKNIFDSWDRQCLQQLLTLLQDLEINAIRSCAGSLSGSFAANDGPQSLDMLESRICDSNSGLKATIKTTTTTAITTITASAAAAAAATGPILASTVPFQKQSAKASSQNFVSNQRIVATVQPYNSCASSNTVSADTPRKLQRPAWQNSSLSESGVFVETDFLVNDLAGVKSATTQTELADEPGSCLKFYEDRLELLEGKLLIYESSGDKQVKHLAERLQREIQLEKQLKEISDRVDYLEQANLSLEEEKCEFEEAENDTRLRLQRLEVELEILTQRNIELELSKEALSAKYKDCRAECLNLRDDLTAYDSQIQSLEEDKKNIKSKLENLQRFLALFVIFKLYCVGRSANSIKRDSAIMGNDNLHPIKPSEPENVSETAPASSFEKLGKKQFSSSRLKKSSVCSTHDGDCSCQERELNYLKEEVKSLRHQMKALHSHHYEALETADSHWVDMERQYKEREESNRVKEASLKQKIAKLQDCLRDDARAANEKIQQLEEAEQGLKTCLVRVSREHRELLEAHKSLIKEVELLRYFKEELQNEQKPISESLEAEKMRSKNLIDELTFLRKVHKTDEDDHKKETDELRGEIFILRKNYRHLEVSNGELKEEVATLEAKILELEKALREHEEAERVLQDELRTKDELLEHEKKSGKSEELETNSRSLAQELYESPSKRLRRDESLDFKSAAQGLEHVLSNLEEVVVINATHQDESPMLTQSRLRQQPLL